MIAALEVRGPYRGASGHDHHVREFVRHLARAGVRLQLVDLPEWGPVKLPDEARDLWFDTLGAPVDAAVALHFCMPHQVVTARGALTVNYTMFEASRIPHDWVEHGLRHDLVIVPTESSRQAWLAGGVPPERIRICPLGVDAESFHPEALPLDLRDRAGRPIRDYRTRVLNVSEVTPRKNLLALLRIWIEATSTRDDALLVVKLGRGRAGATVALMRDLDAVEQAMGKSRRYAAPILFVDRVLADAAMPGLFAAATHYWSMSRGEGWDQPMVEAAATGLRLIAPRHSAYTAYLDDSVATLLSARSVPAIVEDDPGLRRLFEGALWWEPDEVEAAAAVRRAVEGRDTPRAAARERVVPALSWTAAAARLLATLAELATSSNGPSSGSRDERQREDPLALVIETALTCRDRLTPDALDAVVAALDPRDPTPWAPPLAAILYARPDLAGSSLIDCLIAVLVADGVVDSAIDATAIGLEALVGSDLAIPAVTALLGVLRRPDLAPGVATRLVAVLRTYATWRPELLDAESLVVLAETAVLVNRDVLLTHVLEPLLVRAPERVTAALVARIQTVFGDCPRLPYTLHTVGERHGVAAAVRELIAPLTGATFPERLAARALLTSRPFQLLAVFNVQVGQGDEIIRLVPLLQGLLDANPELEGIVLTPRPHLYDHPRVRTVSIADGPAVSAALATRPDGVIHVHEPTWPEVAVNPTVEIGLGDLVAAERPALVITGEERQGRFVYPSVRLGGRDISARRSLDRITADNVYDGCRRLLAELGLPARVAEEAPRGPCVLTGTRSVDAEQTWAVLTAGLPGPVALVNPYGGADRIKGYLPERAHRLGVELTALVAEGYGVVLIPNGTAWGSRAAADDAVSRLAPDVRPRVRVAPDPAEADPARHLALTGRPGLSYADRVMRLFKYFASYAELVITVEGYMAHLAYHLGRPFRLLLAAQSVAFDWHPWPCGPGQRLATSLSPRAAPAAPDVLGPDARPPLPPSDRKPLFRAALAGVHRLGPGRAMPILCWALASEDHDIRASAVAACGGFLPAEPARRHVLDALVDRQPRVRQAAAEALIASGTECSRELGPRFRELLAAHRDIARQDWAAVLRSGAAALAALFVAADGESPPIRREARRVLGRVLAAIGVARRDVL